MACLDTSALLDLTGTFAGGAGTRARRIVAALLEQGEALCTTRFNVAELFVGIERSRDSEREASKVADSIGSLRVLDFDQSGVAQFAKIKAELLRTGRPVGDMDILIGATAVAHGESLVTRNTRDFGGMPGLVVLHY
jgi:tRNA(fMet)-specific endonuclease VapC